MFNLFGDEAEFTKEKYVILNSQDKNLLGKEVLVSIPKIEIEVEGIEIKYSTLNIRAETSKGDKLILRRLN